MTTIQQKQSDVAPLSRVWSTSTLTSLNRLSCRDRLKVTIQFYLPFELEIHTPVTPVLGGKPFTQISVFLRLFLCELGTALDR